MRGATAVALVSIGIGPLALAGGSEPARPTVAGAVAHELTDRQDSAASRSLRRDAAPAASPGRAGTPPPATNPPSKPSTAPKAKPTPTKTVPAPVGHLTRRQMDHAAVIVRVGQQMGMPKRAYVVAIATALQESYLRNLANWYYPDSLDLANDGVGADHDSVGLFQQRPSAGWGTVAQCMDPAYAARRFYEKLGAIAGWQSLPLTAAAQAVQVSAFPDAYAKHEVLATLVTEALS